MLKDWFEPKLIRNIQIFLGYTNFYFRFIENFKKIAISVSLILKILILLDKSAIIIIKINLIKIIDNNRVGLKFILDKSKKTKINKLKTLINLSKS